MPANSRWDLIRGLKGQRYAQIPQQRTTAYVPVAMWYTAVNVNFTPGQTTKTQKGRKGIASCTLRFSAPDGGGLPTLRPGRFTPGKDPLPFVYEAWWDRGPVCTGAENLAPIGI